jgi:D-3-phosphoglycerate dehydrogenase
MVRRKTHTMKIAILDDYQDAVRKLDCFQLLADHEVKVFNNTVRGLGQLASRLSEVDASTRNCSISCRVCA